MYKFDTIIRELSEISDLQRESFIWVWNPEKKSPHIGISVNGKYFSLLADSVQSNIDLQNLIHLIERKKKPILFIQLNSSLSIGEVSTIFNNFSSCQINQCSCSAPLFELFDLNYTEGLIFDLLLELESQNKLSTFSTKNISQPFKGIPTYTYEDVLLNLKSLEKS